MASEVLQLWDIEKWHLIAKVHLLGHTGALACARFADLFSTCCILSGGSARKVTTVIEVWNLCLEESTRKWEVVLSGAWSACLSDNGRFIAAVPTVMFDEVTGTIEDLGSAEWSSIRIFDISTKEELALCERLSGPALFLSEALLLCWDERRQRLIIVELPSCRIVHSVVAPITVRSMVQPIRNSDGSYFALQGNQALQVWDSSQLTCPCWSFPIERDVDYFGFLGCGAVGLSGSFGQIKIINIETGKMAEVFSDERACHMDIAFSPASGAIASIFTIPMCQPRSISEISSTLLLLLPLRDNA